MLKIPENIAIEGLENEKPFTAVCKALKFVADNYNPECQPAARVGISDSFNPEKQSALPGEPFPILPPIDILYTGKEHPLFEVILCLDGFVTADSGSAVDCWRKSRYSSLFTNDNNYSICFDYDIEGVAGFVSYYMRLFGYAEENDFRIDKYIALQEGDISRLGLSDNIAVPETLRRAIAKIRDRGITDADELVLTLGASDAQPARVSFFVGFSGDRISVEFQHSMDKEEYERTASYHNAGIFHSSYSGDSYFICFGLATEDIGKAMRLITDFYQHQAGSPSTAPSVELDFL